MSMDARLRIFLAVLDEANVVGLLPEALAADVQAVLADETTLVTANAAATKLVSSPGGVANEQVGNGSRPSGERYGSR